MSSCLDFQYHLVLPQVPLASKVSLCGPGVVRLHHLQAAVLLFHQLQQAMCKRTKVIAVSLNAHDTRTFRKTSDSEFGVEQDFLFFNAVPKAGSGTFFSLIANKSRRNGVNILRDYVSSANASRQKSSAEQVMVSASAFAVKNLQICFILHAFSCVLSNDCTALNVLTSTKRRSTSSTLRTLATEIPSTLASSGTPWRGSSPSTPGPGTD